MKQRIQRQISKFVILVFMLMMIGIDCQRYKKIIHTIDPDAKCLDGSPPALYVHEGGQTDKILIFIAGGGYCQGQSQSQVIQQCYERSKTMFGSSKLWPQQLDGEGYLSINNTENKFSNWTKFIFAYCDGSLHQGYRSNPIKYKDASLYFKGQKIIKAQISYLQKYYQFSKANKIIWSGSSAGAIGTYLWSEYLKEVLGNIDHVYFIVDSGIFVDLPGHGTQTHHFADELQSLYRVANAEAPTPLSKCNLAHVGNEWKCLLLQYNYEYIQGNYLFINSQYDSWAIPGILKIKCLTNTSTGIGYTLVNCSTKQRDAIEQYRKQYQFLQFNLLLVVNKSSCWSIACSNHVYTCTRATYQSQLQQVPEMSGITVRSTVEKFVLEEQKGIVHMDHQPWPNNHPCSL